MTIEALGWLVGVPLVPYLVYKCCARRAYSVLDLTDKPPGVYDVPPYTVVHHHERRESFYGGGGTFRIEPYRSDYVCALEHSELELPLGVHGDECRQCKMGRKLLQAGIISQAGTCHTVRGSDTIRTWGCPHDEL